ncbi:uncharacterized protein [Amphiura filiformis]|uniref:uncharacterized protein n=1 Tax=Amphiura filiformis TaxID=82378 RepID=UPI003B20E550
MASSPGPGLILIDDKDITIGRILGEGGFGAVYKAKHVNWGEVAVKRLKGVILTADVQKEADRMLKVVSSPYIVTVMGLMKNPKDVGIVMEYFDNGSLKDFEKKYMKCDCWSRKVKMVQDIAFGMNYLHTLDQPIIHRDLKLENVFVGDGFEAKIGDLGLAVSSKSSLQKAGSSGTLTHMPPEAFSSKSTGPDEFWDIFTFAITSYELISGNDPWPQINEWNAPIDVWVRNGERPDLTVLPPEAPSELIDVIKKCWEGEPMQRPSFKDILNSITELFEAKYKCGLRRADIMILEQMDRVQEAEEAKGSSATDSGMVNDPWASLEAMSVKDNTETVTSMEASQDTTGKDSGLGAESGLAGASPTTVTDTEMRWQYRHTVDPGGYVYAIRMIGHNHLALCKFNCIKVYKVNDESSHLAYTVASDEWKGNGTDVAVSESLPDSMLVICEGKSYVYHCPCHESTKEIKRYKIQKRYKLQRDVNSPRCIAANANVAVIATYKGRSIVVCKLPDFKHQYRVSTDYSIFGLSITSDYLLVRFTVGLVVRSLIDVSQDLCRIQPPARCSIKCISCRNNGREVYAVCSQHDASSHVYKYTWTGVGKPEYINSGCIIDDLHVVRMFNMRLSVTSSGLLALKQDNKVTIYKLH